MLKILLNDWGQEKEKGLTLIVWGGISARGFYYRKDTFDRSYHFLTPF